MAKKVKPLAKAKPAAKKTAKVTTAVVAAPVVKRATKASLAADERTAKLSAKWVSYYNKAEAIETTPYNMKNNYTADTAINHKLLGWGYIVDNKNDRLEVLFKDGIKYLISNYK
jgi:hypothetical protein